MSKSRNFFFLRHDRARLTTTSPVRVKLEEAECNSALPSDGNKEGHKMQSERVGFRRLVNRTLPAEDEPLEQIPFIDLIIARLSNQRRPCLFEQIWHIQTLFSAPYVRHNYAY